jgi:hypothetical protein
MARSLLLLAILMASSITPSQAQNSNPPFPLPPFLTPRGTPEDQRNCREDAVKLCKEVAGNDDEVLRCFQVNRVRLSPSCRGVLEKYGK